jgi:hypothetical protein
MKMRAIVRTSLACASILTPMSGCTEATDAADTEAVGTVAETTQELGGGWDRSPIDNKYAICSMSYYGPDSGDSATQSMKIADIRAGQNLTIAAGSFTGYLSKVFTGEESSSKFSFAMFVVDPTGRLSFALTKFAGPSEPGVTTGIAGMFLTEPTIIDGKTVNTVQLNCDLANQPSIAARATTQQEVRAATLRFGTTGDASVPSLPTFRIEAE